MCLSTAYKTSEPDSIIMEYVSKIEVGGRKSDHPDRRDR